MFWDCGGFKLSVTDPSSIPLHRTCELTLNHRVHDQIVLKLTASFVLLVLLSVAEGIPSSPETFLMQHTLCSTLSTACLLPFMYYISKWNSHNYDSTKLHYWQSYSSLLILVQQYFSCVFVICSSRVPSSCKNHILKISLPVAFIFIYKPFFQMLEAKYWKKRE